MPEGQSQAGLYYYYHVFGKAMAAWGEPVITDAKGVKHNWRHELIDQLAGAVKEDGSWVNTADRWQESSPVLTTVFAVLAMEEAVRGQDNAASTPAVK
jgi:squalene-hopene/tetraprenyl-beta-curcumene cyclase